MMKLRRHRRSPWALALSALIILSVSQPSRADDPPARSSTSQTTGAKLDYLDAMLKASWEQSSIKPSKRSGDEEFLRRAYLDVLGRIPNVREANAFLRG